MRRTLTVLVVGLVAAVLGIVGLVGVASAANTTLDQAVSQEVDTLKKDAQGGTAPQAPRPQKYGSR
jgi:hypothetical protein